MGAKKFRHGALGWVIVSLVPVRRSTCASSLTWHLFRGIEKLFVGGNIGSTNRGESPPSTGSRYEMDLAEIRGRFGWRGARPGRVRVDPDRTERVGVAWQRQEFRAIPDRRRGLPPVVSAADGNDHRAHVEPKHDQRRRHRDRGRRGRRRRHRRRGRQPRHGRGYRRGWWLPRWRRHRRESYRCGRNVSAAPLQHRLYAVYVRQGQPDPCLPLRSAGPPRLVPRPFRPLRPFHASDPLRLLHLLDLLRLLPQLFHLVRFVLSDQVALAIRHSADGLADLVSGREAVLLEILGHLAPAHVGIPVDEGLRLTGGVTPAKAKEGQGLAGGK